MKNRIWFHLQGSVRRALIPMKLQDLTIYSSALTRKQLYHQSKFKLACDDENVLALSFSIKNEGLTEQIFL